MYRTNIYSVAVIGDHCKWIFTVAAKTKEFAIRFINAAIEEDIAGRYPGFLCPQYLTEHDVKCVAYDAAVDREGILFSDGYNEH